MNIKSNIIKNKQSSKQIKNEYQIKQIKHYQIKSNIIKLNQTLSN